MKPKNLKFREDFKKGEVVVLDGRKELFRNGEYRVSAEWAMNRYNLSQAEMYALYSSYKADYDKKS